MQTVHEMPLEELRARARDVDALLRSAREELARALGGTHADLDACVVQLGGALARVEELLPGAVSASPESVRRLEAEDRAARESTSRADQERARRLSDVEVARAQALLAELRDGLDRMQVLQSVGDAVDEVVAMIERARAELRAKRAG